MTKVVVKGTVMVINCLTTKAFLFIYNVVLFSNNFVCVLCKTSLLLGWSCSMFTSHCALHGEGFETCSNPSTQ